MTPRRIWRLMGLMLAAAILFLAGEEFLALAVSAVSLVLIWLYPEKRRNR